MKEFVSQYLPVIMGMCLSVLSALVGFLVVFFNSRKAKYEYQQKLAEKETENIALQKALIEGSYIICPNCGSKIFLKDVQVFTQDPVNVVVTNKEVNQ